MITRERVNVTREAIASYIVSTADYGRADRLWPAHYLVFSTNPLSIAYGAAGICLLLRRVLGRIPPAVRGWLLRHHVSAADYPPGLLVGTAGIAYAFWEIGLKDEAETVMETCYQSPMLFRDPTMFHGAAGWGLASLYFHERTGKEIYLDNALQAADFLLRTAKSTGRTSYWLRPRGERVNYGYGYGASGIALFLLRAGLVFGREDLVKLAQRGVEFDLSHLHEDTYGWTWTDVEGGSRFLRYWEHGSAGVGATVIRLYRELGDAKYLAAAEMIAEGASTKWTILPNLLTGLSGIGEFMLDMFFLTGHVEYVERALDMAATVLWYAIERPTGIAFPGRWLGHISNDYATGSAGVGLFLDRIVEPKSRYLVDMGRALPSDAPATPLVFPVLGSLWHAPDTCGGHE